MDDEVNEDRPVSKERPLRNEGNTSNVAIDKLTLELFMNKSKYNKYIQKTDPRAYEEKQQYLDNLRRHRRAILELTKTLVDDPDTMITTDVNAGFHDYTKVLISYLEMKSLDMSRDTHTYVNEDEDMLFSNMDSLPSLPTTSFWGKERISRRGYFKDV
jgi:hypothetical protein